MAEADHLAADLVIGPKDAGDAPRLERLAAAIAAPRPADVASAPDAKVPLSIPDTLASQRIARIEHVLVN
jgi:hypothetical protein